MKEANGKFVPPEDGGSEIIKDMTAESVKQCCLSARDARVKRFKKQDEEVDSKISGFHDSPANPS